MYNLILDIDSYKASHYKQYPQHTQRVSSYIESRGGKYSHNLFFGLQRFIKKYLQHPITQQDIDQAEQVLTKHGLPFNRAGWQHILTKHHGFLPLKIEAVPEGTLVNSHNVLVQVSNTDPECFWLTSYIETALLRAVWYPTTVATLSFKCKQIIYDYLLATSDLSEEQIQAQLAFKLHDFGARGASSTETSQLGGLAHLVNFQGTDSVLSLLDAQEFYACDMAGFSIPAAEHSTVTAWGKEQEYQAYENILNAYLKLGKMVSVVCDSYDMNLALETMIGSPALKEKIKWSGGTVIIRPDSGDPAQIVTETAQKLEEIFGCSFNNSGYKVLPPYIRIIQGDGINTNSITAICQNLQDHGYSIENIAFGMGAELQQKVNRDTCRFAMKASAVQIGNQWQDAYKAPVTDLSKTSKRGILKLIAMNGQFVTVRQDDVAYADIPNLLELVYDNGKLVREQTFEQIRSIANSQLTTKVDYFA